MKALTSWQKHCQKAPPPNAIKLSIRISTYECGVDTNIQTVAPSVTIQKPETWRK